MQWCSSLMILKWNITSSPNTVFIYCTLSTGKKNLVKNRARDAGNVRPFMPASVPRFDRDKPASAGARAWSILYSPARKLTQWNNFRNLRKGVSAAKEPLPCYLSDENLNPWENALYQSGIQTHIFGFLDRRSTNWAIEPTGIGSESYPI